MLIGMSGIVMIVSGPVAQDIQPLGSCTIACAR